MEKTNAHNACPAYSLEKEAIREEIESGLHSGVERLGTGAGTHTHTENFHNTKYLLKQYRRVVYAVQMSEAELDLRLEMEHGVHLSSLEDNALLAGVDLSGTKAESHARTIVRSRNMLEIIDSALNAVREDPGGELLYNVLYQTYFTKRKPQNRDQIIRELEEAGFTMSVASYHNYLNAGIRAIDKILWGYTARDCMEIIKQFLPE